VEAEGPLALAAKRLGWHVRGPSAGVLRALTAAARLTGRALRCGGT
jgi:hypothetical protein